MTEFKKISGKEPCLAVDRASRITARVTGMQRDTYEVVSCYGKSQARLKGAFLRSKEKEEYPVLGDWVQISYREGGLSFIEEICERKSSFSRTDFSGHAAGYVKTVKRQVLAANFDLVFILSSLNHEFNLNRIMRYICLAIQGGAEPVVVLTKADLCPNPDSYVDQVKQLTDKASVFAISAQSGYGMEVLKEQMIPGKTIALLGSSGVGKSTLVNAIAGAEIMVVSRIRNKDSRGRHTTTHRQMIELSSGVLLMDMPGIREIGMWDAKEGIEEAFSDIAELTSQCKFANCQHGSETGCAIQEAIEDGGLSQARWEMYRQLMEENEWGLNKAMSVQLAKVKSKKRRGHKNGN